MQRLFSVDPVTRTRKTFHWNESDESFVIETKQDVTDAVELTQAEFNAMDERSRWGDMSKVASIPMTEVAELQRKGIWQDDRALLKWLDDRNNRKYRTRPGRLA